MLAAIPSPSNNGVHLGPLFIHAYGLAYVVAIIAAVMLTQRRWAAAGGRHDLVIEVAMWAVPAGLIGGRLYFLLTSWDQVPPHWWGPAAVWDGGLGIWGGIAAGTLAGIVLLRRRGVDTLAFMDAVAPGLLLAQAIGRIGNYFNQELFGGPSTLPWALHIDPAHRPVGYANVTTFHPTFLYELIWNLVLAALLVRLGHRGRVRRGGLFALYVAGYSLGRIGEELLRVDPAHHILGLRLNFFVASTLTLAGLACFAHLQGWLTGRRAGRVTLILAGTSLAAWGACGCGQSRASAATPTHAIGVPTVPPPMRFRGRPFARPGERPPDGRRRI